ncbi:hypothetical protein ABMA28_007647 [Loxostege sticticalis]|uniref:Carboxypeptidase n=1 Tax=Loxostege sticticalis TaxID=481309 RepID=A0ABD0SI83_LOXSC
MNLPLCTLFLFVRNVKVNDGPLLLTPLIEKGKYEKARSLSKVDPTLFAGLQSHSACITVNKTLGSHLFFWFFPVLDKPLESTPWIIWLQGGPGVSSLFGVFLEIGPLQFINGTALFHVSTNLYLIFLVGANLLNFIQQFLTVFPELRKAPLFIAGESYGGKFVPAFGHYIHINRNSSHPINFKGVAIGNGLIDPPTMLQYSKFGVQVGILDLEEAAKIKAIEDAAKNAYKEGDMDTYRHEWIHTLLSYSSYLLNSYNYVFDEEPSNEYVQFLNNIEIQRALHTGRTVFTAFNWMVFIALLNDFPLSVKPWLEELLDNYYGVLSYGSQLDIIVPYASLESCYHTLQWWGAEEYIKAPRWRYRGTGKRPEMYIKQYGNFMDVMIRGAGHMTSYDRPQAAKDLIKLYIDEFQDYQGDKNNNKG